MRGRRGYTSWSGSSLDLFDSGSSAPFAATVQREIPGATAASAVPVAAVTETARAAIEGALPPLWVRGEISDFKRHRNGHWYFCLRDATAQMRCVVWSRSQRAIPASPDDGMQVSAFGQLTVYPARGELHMNVMAIEAAGDGLWRKALEETRVKLERDGLLDASRKRELPACPRVVGVVTSLDGAALRDVIAVVRRRAPHVSIVVCGTAVQGASAPAGIAAAIERVCRWGGADVLIVGRGGGSREDLWAFNDEAVARAIAAANIPVISAVGHEIDITIADLVADHRAATPSAAAEAAVPVRALLRAALSSTADVLHSAISARIADERRFVANGSRALADGTRRLVAARSSSLNATAGRLDALSPLATLARGYAVARDPHTRRTLNSVAQFEPGAIFTLTVSDGDVAATRVEQP